MKILITSLPDLKKINLQRPHHIIQYLSERHDVTIISGNAQIPNPVDDPLVKNCLKNADYYYLSNNPTNPIIQELQILKIIQKNSLNKDPFDIHLNFHSILSCYLIQKKLKLPTVMDICDDLLGWISHSPHINPIIRPLGSRISKYILLEDAKHSKKIIFSVKSLQELYEIPESKSEIIPNGVDIGFFSPNNIVEERKFNNRFCNYTLGFVGFLGDWVDLTPMFDAVSQLKNIIKLKILIVGDGPKLEEFKKKSREYDLFEDVIFIGNVPYSEIPEFISQMDVCILPFDNSSVSQHALPLKLFEYMASKKPVISSRIKAVEKTIGNKVLYYSNSNEFKNNLEELYHNKKLMEEMSIQGHIFVSKKYSWNSILDTYEKVLIDVYNQRET